MGAVYEREERRVLLL